MIGKTNSYTWKVNFKINKIQLRVEFSDLLIHRLHHNFNCSTAVCACSNEDEFPEHYLLRCPLFCVLSSEI
jgi:hypothetical protein